MSQKQNNRIPLIIIQGVTAVGKSKLAFKLAQKLGSSIISADSRQVYKYLNIGTAKPTIEDQNRIKHHLIDIVKPNEEYNAGTFSEDAYKLIKEISSHDKIPIICGGTGFYIKALLEGIFKAPEIPNEIRQYLRKAAEIKGTEFFYEKLKKIDPDSARRINDNDTNRILRALEIFETTGKTITQLWEEDNREQRKFQTINIMITEERNILYDRVNRRVDKMIDNGLLNEMKELINSGYKRTDPGMNTVGYKELFPFLDGEKELVDCIDKIKQNTRNFAKRQLTWYRKIDFDLTLDSKNINFSNVFKEIMIKLQER
ncbi:MAG: tRNA (adenosine(37)-N6)-dimethylallyltransferase MiaA [Candidatus Cloacimonadota bacterium]|nr:tRNA (adenosine(37)-N6)-dimethylallyltransferase MiaA [Candidatus Cloacimonadota bacterium]